MKKLIVLFSAAVLMLTIVPSYANEATRPAATSIVSTKPGTPAEVQVLIDRVNEINAMDKSALSSSEKKALRSELRTIKKEVNQTSGNVVYVSAGLILLIILLIILL